MILIEKKMITCSIHLSFLACEFHFVVKLKRVARGGGTFAHSTKVNFADIEEYRCLLEHCEDSELPHYLQIGRQVADDLASQEVMTPHLYIAIFKSVNEWATSPLADKPNPDIFAKAVLSKPLSLPPPIPPSENTILAARTETLRAKRDKQEVHIKLTLERIEAKFASLKSVAKKEAYAVEMKLIRAQLEKERRRTEHRLQEAIKAQTD